MRSQRLPPIAAGGMLEIIPVQGVFETNAYLYADDATGRGFIVDPGAMPERLLGAVEARGVAVEHILLTHGHFDHMGVAGQLAQALGVPVRMASEGRRFAEDPQMNLSAACGLAVVLASPAYFDAGSRPVFTAGMLGLEAIPAPGHTPDSVVYYSQQDGIAFVGDTIFRAGDAGISRGRRARPSPNPRRGSRIPARGNSALFWAFRPHDGGEGDARPLVSEVAGTALARLPAGPLAHCLQGVDQASALLRQRVLHVRRHFVELLPSHDATGNEVFKTARQSHVGYAGKLALECAEPGRTSLVDSPEQADLPLSAKQARHFF